MIRFNYHIPGTAPATLLHREDSRETEVTLLSYDAQSWEENAVASMEDINRLFRGERINWINIEGLADVDFLRAVAERFGMHPLALEDALQTGQRPKIEPVGECLFIISGMLYFESRTEIVSEQVGIFAGANFVITFQEGRGEDLFERIRNRIRSGTGYARKMGSDYLLYAILDALIDNNFPILEVLGDGLEELEEILLRKPTPETLRKLYEVKRLLLQVRREIWPHREILGFLTREEEGFCQRETRIFFRDCYDHTTQLIDMVESYRDLGAGLMDLYLSSVGIRTNEIMRILTIVSTCFIPLTFLAGVYGMNFETQFPLNMPELGWPYGYLFFWALCLVIAGSLLFFFKRRKWL